MRRAIAAWKRVWQGIREWCGDAAYEQYVRAQRKHGCGSALLTREEFYVEQLQKKYSRPSRCC
ncbi:MAG TPA: YbdD/YjiX family protein [Dongiaceae bacterium]|nr:YbdD/YjiX family protein [Dongiaceae bacterium]